MCVCVCVCVCVALNRMNIISSENDFFFIWSGLHREHHGEIQSTQEYEQLISSRRKKSTRREKQ